ncbi:hypothetical protein Agub_g7237, partial [Astrephomene gubernaculifera]
GNGGRRCWRWSARDPGGRHVHERLGAAVGAAAAEAAEAGCECLLLALDALKDALEALAAEQQQQQQQAAAEEEAVAAAADSSGVSGTCSTGSGSTSEEEGLLCVLVWLHHLKSLGKRKLIVQWARELELAGACKPGFPGVVVVEGHSVDVREFLARMRQLSWQAMQVRGQDLLRPPPLPTTTTTHGSRSSCSSTDTLSAGGSAAAAGAPDRGDAALGCMQQRLQGLKLQGSGVAVGGVGCGAGDVARRAAVQSLRRLGCAMPFAEVDEEGGMSQLGVMCREAGLQHVFMTALKL